MSRVRATVPLTCEQARKLFRYDPQTGDLYWKVTKGSRSAGKKAGCPNHGYVIVHVDKVRYFAHRVIWLLVTGEWPPCLVDHRDCNGLNNRWENLRAASHVQNGRNRRLSRRNKSGVTGVSFSGRYWFADIGIDRKVIHLGWFSSRDEAIEARRAAEKKYFGEFANTAALEVPDAA